MGEPSEARTTSPLGRLLDSLSDLALLALAAWTLLAWLGMLTGAPVTALVTAWLLLLVLGILALVALSRRGEPAGGNAAAGEGEARRTPRVGLLGGAAAGGLLSAVLAVTASGLPWVVIWLPAALAVGLAVTAGRLDLGGPSTQRTPASAAGDVFAAATGFGFGVMALFLHNQDSDDTFYVNRATATAELGRIPVDDVLFTREAVPPISGTGLPIESFHALQGALGRLIDVHAASVAYFVTPAVFGFLATWALWRLIRSWAPRYAPLCFALGAVFWLWSAQFVLSPGSFFLGRLWQGKVVFVAWLVPTLYVLLTRWLERPDRRTGVLLVAGGVTALGLTASATFVAPLLFLTAAIPLALARRWRPLALVAVAGLVPLLVGGIVSLRFGVGESFDYGRSDAPWYYENVFGVEVVGLVAAIAVWLAPLIVRAGAAAAVTTGIALVAVLLLAPGALTAIGDLTDVNEPLRRTLWVVPFPALVGLLAAAAASLPARRPLAALAGAALVAGLLVAFGQPLWRSPGGQSYWRSPPAWKTHERPLANARTILRRYDGSGSILAARRVMEAIAIQTSRRKAINPRAQYMTFLTEPKEWRRHRVALSTFARGIAPGLPAVVLRSALDELDVGLVCLDRSSRRERAALESGTSFRRDFRVGGHVCLRDAGGS